MELNFIENTTFHTLIFYKSHVKLLFIDISFIVITFPGFAAH